MLARRSSTLLLLALPLTFVIACSSAASTGGGSGGRSTSGSGGSSHSSSAGNGGSSVGSGGSSPTSGSGSTGGSSTGGQDAGADATDGSIGVTCSGASPSFMNDVHPILAGCAGEMCHGDILPIWPYQRLVNVLVSRDTCDPSAVIVKPGSLEDSYLMHKLTGVGMCPNTSQMPSMGHPLPSPEIQTIADWICQGALNN
jgi:hypothetical protein